MLDDRKAASLPDSSWRRFVECILLAMETNRGGILPSVPDMAWRLRVTPETMGDDLTRLALAGLVHLNDNNEWTVTNFVKRQAAVPVAERVANHRERQKQNNQPPSNADATQPQRESNEGVTKSYTDKTRLDKTRLDEMEVEKRAPAQPSPPKSRAPKPQPSMITDAHPAIRAIYQVTTFWPAEASHPVIVEKVGDAPNVEALGRAYQLWVSRGYNPKNFDAILEWYKELTRDPAWMPPPQHKNGKPAPKDTGITPMKEVRPGVY